jgi:hypothetical protein
MILKWTLGKYGWGCGPVRGSCEYSNESLGAKRGGGILGLPTRTI